MKIAIGSDHRGLDIKDSLISFLIARKISVLDMGTHDGESSVDYPDYATKVSAAVSRKEADLGILICGTGIGMAIVANKFFGVRAALVHDVETAKYAKEHNNANVLVLGGNKVSSKKAEGFVDNWLSARFEGGRHKKRLDKIDELETNLRTRYNVIDILRQEDSKMASLVEKELRREQDTLILIASENLASKPVLAAQGSVFTNKYAEGYPGKRYYGGCEYCDEMESIAIERAMKLFGSEHANVQSISGSAANLAAYFAMISPGDTMLAMKLAHGGHLTHGAPVSVVGKIFKMVHYGVRKEDGLIDYDEVEKLAREHRPKMIVAGASSYSRFIDFDRFRKIADSVKAYLMVDMAHIAGLVAAGAHPSPVPYSDIVTSTTHKTLRGPRGGFILCREEFRDKVDKAVFPGLQGGPLMHTVVAKAVCFKEAMTTSFKKYQMQVVKNAKMMASCMLDNGFRIVSGGTDNHLFLLDLSNNGLTGKAAETVLEEIGIVVNKNAVPFDEKPPTLTSGIRIGTPFVTSRGMKEKDVMRVSAMIADVLKHPHDVRKKIAYKAEVLKLCKEFPIYSELV